MEIEDILKYTLTLFQDIDKRLSELRNQQSIWDIKQDELLHYIENHNIDAVRACKIVKQLKYVRGERRKVKDEIDVVVSLKNTFIDKYKNKFIEKDLIQALKNLKELEQRIKQKQEVGMYYYESRVRNTHLSKGQATDFLLNNMGKNSEYVFMHEHVER